MEGGRFQYYAMRRGRVPGIYGTWLECKRQVTGFKNNDYKGLKDLDDAKAWLGAVAEPADFGGGEIQQLAIEAGEQINKETSGKTFRIRSNYPAMEARRPMKLKTPVGARQLVWMFAMAAATCGVEGCPMKEGPFLHVEDMELLLMRAYSSLGIEAPIFVCQENRSSEEAVRFAFTVVLPYNSMGLELVVHGPTSADVRVARQEVSFAMLEKIVAAIGYTICDYNYRTVARMEERWREIQDASLASMAHQIRHLEEENADLQHQVEMINEMLEE